MKTKSDFSLVILEEFVCGTVTRLSALPETVILSNLMRVKSDSQENHASVQHPRTLFWGVNISRLPPTRPGEEHAQEKCNRSVTNIEGKTRKSIIKARKDTFMTGEFFMYRSEAKHFAKAVSSDLICSQLPAQFSIHPYITRDSARKGPSCRVRRAPWWFWLCLAAGAKCLAAFLHVSTLYVRSRRKKE